MDWYAIINEIVDILKYKTMKNKITNNKNDTLIIQGITESGETFRPNDWAERMSGNLSTFRNHRIYYSPLLQPMMKNGHKCVLLDKRLQDSNPALYQSILNFAKKNALQICKDDADEAL